MTGIVVKSTGSRYQVLLSNHRQLSCLLKGNVRLTENRSTNPIAVGDIVVLEIDGEQGLISSIQPRKNYIVRKSINLSKKFHVLAANIDQMFVMATIQNPRTPYGFIDRMLVTAEAYGIQGAVIINKSDLWSQEDQLAAEEMKETYTTIGYHCYIISVQNNNQVNELKSKFNPGVSLLIGHSGTGKSSLLNAFNPLLEIKTAEISAVHQQGKHTTTFAEMHEIAPDSFVVDTPGIREFGLIEMQKYELGHYFPEFRAIMHECRFNNCLHINEPHCAVLEAVKNNEIPFTRYRSYLSMMEGETEVEYE